MKEIKQNGSTIEDRATLDHTSWGSAQSGAGRRATTQYFDLDQPGRKTLDIERVSLVMAQGVRRRRSYWIDIS